MLLFVDGCDKPPIERGWTGGVDPNPTAGRFGGGAYQMPTSNSTTFTHGFTASETVYIGFAYRAWNEGTNNRSPILQLLDASTGLSLITLWHVRPSGQLAVDLLTNGTRVEAAVSSSAGVLLNAYSFIEVGMRCHSTEGWIEVRTQGDPTPVIRLEGINTLRSTMTSGAIGSLQFWQNFTTFPEGRYYVDDIYVTDNNTSVLPAGFIGDCRVNVLTPIADTDVNEWVPSAGTSHFAMVDEPTTDIDATYLQTTEIGRRELFGMSQLTDLPDAIHAIAVNWSSKKTNAGNTRTAGLIRSGENLASGTAYPSLSSYVMRQNCFGRNPAGNSQWTMTSVNAIAAGFETQGTG